MVKNKVVPKYRPKWDRNPTETKCGASPSKTHLRACRGRGISLGLAEKILVDSRKPWLLLLQRLLTLSPTNTSTQLSSGFSHPVFSFKMAGGEGNNPSLPSPAPAPVLWGCFLWVGQAFCAWALPPQGFKPACSRIGGNDSVT